MSLSLGTVSLRVEVDVRHLHESLSKAIESFKVPDIRLSIDSIEALKEAKLFRDKVAAPIVIPVQLDLSAATKQYEEFVKTTAKLDPFKSIAESKKKLTEDKTAIAVSFDGAQLDEELSGLQQKVKEAAVQLEVRTRGAGFLSGLTGIAGGALNALGGVLSAYSSLQSAKTKIEVLLDKTGAIEQFKELVELLGRERVEMVVDAVIDMAGFRSRTSSQMDVYGAELRDRPFEIPLVLNDRELKAQAGMVRRMLAHSVQLALPQSEAASVVISADMTRFDREMVEAREAINALDGRVSRPRVELMSQGVLGALDELERAFRLLDGREVRPRLVIEGGEDLDRTAKQAGALLGGGRDIPFSVKLIAPGPEFARDLEQIALNARRLSREIPPLEVTVKAVGVGEAIETLRDYLREAREIGEGINSVDLTVKPADLSEAVEVLRRYYDEVEKAGVAIRKIDLTPSLKPVDLSGAKALMTSTREAYGDAIDVSFSVSAIEPPDLSAYSSAIALATKNAREAFEDVEAAASDAFKTIDSRAAIASPDLSAYSSAIVLATRQARDAFEDVETAAIQAFRGRTLEAEVVIDYQAPLDLAISRIKADLVNARFSIDLGVTGVDAVRAEFSDLMAQQKELTSLQKDLTAAKKQAIAPLQEIQAAITAEQEALTAEKKRTAQVEILNKTLEKAAENAQKLSTIKLQDLRKLTADLGIEAIGNQSKRSTFEAAILQYLEDVGDLDRAAERVDRAWRRTAESFEEAVKRMARDGSEAGQYLVQFLNHSAADTVAAAWKRTRSVFEVVMGDFVTKASSTGALLVTKFSGAFANLEGTFQATAQNLQSKLNQLSQGIVAPFREAGTSAAMALESALSARIPQAIATIAKAIGSQVSAISIDVGGFFSGLISASKSASVAIAASLAESFTSVKGAIAGLTDSLTEGFKSAVPGIKQFVAETRAEFAELKEIAATAMAPNLAALKANVEQAKAFFRSIFEDDEEDRRRKADPDRKPSLFEAIKGDLGAEFAPEIKALKAEIEGIKATVLPMIQSFRTSIDDLVFDTKAKIQEIGFNARFFWADMTNRVDLFKADTEGAFGDIANSFREAGDRVKQFYQAVSGPGLDSVAAKVTKISEQLRSAFSGGGQPFSAKALIDGLPATIARSASELQGSLETIFDAAKRHGLRASEDLAEAVRSKLAKFKTQAMTTIDDLKGAASKAIDFLKTADFGPAFENMTDSMARDLVSGVKAYSARLAEATGIDFAGVMERAAGTSLAKAVGNAIEGGKDQAISALSEFSAALRKAVDVALNLSIDKAIDIAMAGVKRLQGELIPMLRGGTLSDLKLSVDKEGVRESLTDAADKVSGAWKRTQSAFSKVADEMTAKADVTGKELVNDLNHSAADTVAAAWKRTKAVYADVMGQMVEMADATGGTLADRLGAAARVAAMRVKAALAGGMASLKESIGNQEAFTDPFLAMRKAIQAARVAFAGLQVDIVDAGSDIVGLKAKAASLQTAGAGAINGLGDSVAGFRQKILDATGATTLLGAAVRGAFSAAAIGGFVVGVTGAVKGIQMLHQPLMRLNQMLAGISHQSFEFAKSATTAAAEVDGALRRANAIAGGTKKTYEELFEAAIKTGADSGVLVSTKDAAMAMETLAKRGKTIDQMVSTSLGLAQLSTATGEKMPVLTGNFLDTAGKFNLSAKEMEAAVKSLSGVLTTGAKSQDAAYFAKYFTPAKQGLEAYKEMLKIQSLLSTAGIRGSNAATSTNRELANLTKSKKLKGETGPATFNSFADIIGVQVTKADGKTLRGEVDLLLDTVEKYRRYVNKVGELKAVADARLYLGTKEAKELRKFSQMTDSQIVGSSLDKELENLTKMKKIAGAKVTGKTTTFADILGVKATEADGKTMRSQLDILLDSAKKYREYVKKEGELQASADARNFLGENGSRALKNFSKLTEEQIARSIKAVEGGAAKMNRVSADALKQIGVGSIAVQNSLESLKISTGKSFAPIFNAISMAWSDLMNRMGTLPILKQIEALASTIATELARPEIAASIKKLQDLFLGLVTSGLNLVLRGVKSFLAFLADTSAVDRFTDAMRLADQTIRGVGRALAWVYSMEVKVAGAMAARIVETGKTGLMDTRIGKAPDTAALAKKAGLDFNPFEGLGKLSFSFGPDFQQSIKNVGIALAPVMSALKDMVIQLGPPLLSAIGGIFKGLTALLIPLGELLATAIRIITIKLTPFVHKVGLIGRAFGEVGQVVGVTLGGLLGFVTEGTKVVQGFVNGLIVSMAQPFHILLDLSSRGTSAMTDMLAGFRSGLSRFGDWVAGWAQVLGSIVGVLKNLGVKSIGSVIASGRSAINLLSAGVRGTQASLAGLGNFVSGVLTGRINIFAGFTKASLGSIRATSAGLLKWMGTAIGNFFAWVRSSVTSMMNLWKWLTTSIRTAWGNMTSAIQGIFSQAMAQVRTGALSLSQYWGTVVNSLRTYWASMLSFIVSRFQSGIAQILSFVTRFFTAFSSRLTGLRSAFDIVRGVVQSISGVLTGWPKLFDGIIAKVKSMGAAAGGFFGGGRGGSGGSFLDQMRSMLDGMGDSMSSSIAGVTLPPQIAAFIEMFRHGEGTLGEAGYRTMFGGGKFSSFADHPRQLVSAGGFTSDAAGMGQFLSTTWDAVAGQLGLKDFSPANQVKAIVQLIKNRGAYGDLMAGDLDSALSKLSYEWASLPINTRAGAVSRYGQPAKTGAEARALFEKYLAQMSGSVKGIAAGAIKAIWSTGDYGSRTITRASQMLDHHDYTVDRLGRRVRDITLEDGRGNTTNVPTPSLVSGRVVEAGDAGDGYGKKVVVRDSSGFETLVGHLHSIAVRVGQVVRFGEIIGGQGSTGNSSGDHLHIGSSDAIINRWVDALAASIKNGGQLTSGLFGRGGALADRIRTAINDGPLKAIRAGFAAAVDGFRGGSSTYRDLKAKVAQLKGVTEQQVISALPFAVRVPFRTKVAQAVEESLNTQAPATDVETGAPIQGKGGGFDDGPHIHNHDHCPVVAKAIAGEVGKSTAKAAQHAHTQVARASVPPQSTAPSTPKPAAEQQKLQAQSSSRKVEITVKTQPMANGQQGVTIQQLAQTVTRIQDELDLRRDYDQRLYLGLG